MLRVLVVLPMSGGSLPVGRYAVEGLRECGCLTEVFEAPDFHPAFAALDDLKVSVNALEALQHSFLQVVSQAILAKAESFAPDLVLSLAQAPLSRLALKRLRGQGVATAMWFVEDYTVFTYWRAFAPLYDIFAVIQKEPFFSELAAIGQANSLYLPLAALPSAHKPLALSPSEQQEFGSELSFMGAGYPNRRKAFLRFIGKDFKIWGTEWEGEPALAPMIQRQGGRISPEDTVRIYNAAAINLNLHSSLKGDAGGGGDFVNPRTFEIAACGGFQLVDRRTLLDELYDEDELARFSGLDELEEKIAYFRARPGERETMAQRARERTLKEHTYTARMRTLLDFAAARIPGFGQRRPVDWPKDMPDGMREAASAMLEELGLPATAAFDEVITALKSKSGQLSDVETAMLFLDEWKKLYLPG